MKYMEMELEKDKQELEQEKARMYIEYLSNIFSQPLMEKPSQQYMQAKKEFEQLLRPESEQNQTAKIYEWDFEKEKRLGNKK